MKRRTLLKTTAALGFTAVMGPIAAAVNDSHGARLKSSLNVYSFNRLLRSGEVDLFDVLDFCAARGFDAVDPTGYYFPGYPAPPPDDYLNRFKKHAFMLGLDISGTGVRNDFVTPDPVARGASRQHVFEWIEVAARMGSPNLRIFTGKSGHEGHPRDAVFEWLADEIQECCKHGERFGVMLAVQNHNEFLKTAADVDRLFATVGSEWLGLNLDIGSFRERDPYTEIEKVVKHAVNWQLKENVWIDGAESPTDFDRLAQVIRRSGYRGYLPLETLGPGDPFEKVPALMIRVRRAGLIDT